MNEKQQDYTHKMNENGVPVYQQCTSLTFPDFG